jgi:hypothetical protein
MAVNQLFIHPFEWINGMTSGGRIDYDRETGEKIVNGEGSLEHAVLLKGGFT